MTQKYTLKRFAVGFVLFIVLSFCACTSVRPAGDMPAVMPSPGAIEPKASAESTARIGVRPSPTQKSAEKPFTIAWMTDTQYYSRSYPQIYLMMTRWLVSSRDKENIVYVVHTGDVVHVKGQAKQWKNADSAMQPLDGKIPYGVLAGNHDVGTKNHDYSTFKRYFGEWRFKEQPYYGGAYDDNRGHYDLISAGGNDYIFVYMGWGVDDDALAWMNAVLAKYPKRTAFVALHEYLSKSGDRSSVGNRIFDAVVKKNSNVRYVLCGHNHGIAFKKDSLDDNGGGKPDRDVYQMMANYQAEPMGGGGYMRLMKFDAAANTVEVRTYSPYLDDYDYFDTGDSFTFPMK